MITIKKLTDKYLLDLACTFTAGYLVETKSLKRMYQCEHSPVRTQLFCIAMYDIPTFVSVHLVRHKIGVEHYVKSNRSDRNGDDKANRYTTINHMMLANAQALINMARKRLCGKASVETQSLMQEIKTLMYGIDSDLAECMVPECQYRGRCYEFQSCGRYKTGQSL